MVGAVVDRLVPQDGIHANITGFEGLMPDEKRVLVASSMTFLMGIFQVFFFFIKNIVPCHVTQWICNFFLIFLCCAACHGCPAGGLHCCVPVWHSGVWFHHGSCCPHPGVPAQVCVRFAGARNQWSSFYHICKSRVFLKVTWFSFQYFHCSVRRSVRKNS